MTDAAAPSIANQRCGVERRQLSWRTVLYGFLRSRRHVWRRNDEVEVRFIDWHHPWLFIMAVGTMLLSGLDAFLTLKLIEHGMVEVNPIMAGAMGISTASFAAMKMALTAFGILALVFLAKARFMDRIRVGLFLTLLFSGYACLICYEIVSLLKLL